MGAAGSVILPAVHSCKKHGKAMAKEATLTALESRRPDDAGLGLVR